MVIGGVVACERHLGCSEDRSDRLLAIISLIITPSEAREAGARVDVRGPQHLRLHLPVERRKTVMELWRVRGFRLLHLVFRGFSSRPERPCYHRILDAIIRLQFTQIQLELNWVLLRLVCHGQLLR